MTGQTGVICMPLAKSYEDRGEEDGKHHDERTQLGPQVHRVASASHRMVGHDDN